jgi:hypothetical protein
MGGVRHGPWIEEILIRIKYFFGTCGLKILFLVS